MDQQTGDHHASHHQAGLEPSGDGKSVTLSDRAVRRIAKILAVEPAGTALRVSVEGGGCSGFQYKYDLVRDTPAADDVILARDGATVLIDTMSLDYMGGSEIDFVDDLMGQSFQIKNPHAVAACGCGTSFSVA
jgi:iron-sulfur cluster assembly accessory protein